ncbi:10842_t:CDS:2 [Entrophospora sp. SA101]|nr:10842_t:CDS:2 [Entrophospora sp. SA101]
MPADAAGIKLKKVKEYLSKVTVRVRYQLKSTRRKNVYMEDVEANNSSETTPSRMLTSISNLGSFNSSSNNATTSIKDVILENVVSECLDDFKTTLHRDIMDMHVELIRQFHIQQSSIEEMFKSYCGDVEALREEVKQLIERILSGNRNQDQVEVAANNDINTLLNDVSSLPPPPPYTYLPGQKSISQLPKYEDEDTLVGLSFKYGVEIKDIRKANLFFDDNIFAHKFLKIPKYIGPSLSEKPSVEDGM